jgi:hypothetical protein
MTPGAASRFTAEVPAEMNLFYTSQLSKFAVAFLVQSADFFRLF